MYKYTNLDDAAHAFAASNFFNDQRRAAAIQGFKAGAKWVAEQGASFNTKVSWIEGPKILDWPDYILNKFDLGDEVIVQIRKKEE